MSSKSTQAKLDSLPEMKPTIAVSVDEDICAKSSATGSHCELKAKKQATTGPRYSRWAREDENEATNTHIPGTAAYYMGQDFKKREAAGQIQVPGQASGSADESLNIGNKSLPTQKECTPRECEKPGEYTDAASKQKDKVLEKYQLREADI
ncbi:hypothetical protein GQ44DRAFT_732411 [Phaeosphaeriaceae sp. PMI808]|nr:hypothetical protein GQ44DRAFT_732411 [Phaeosphaeriaceae sp. PMI808]